jgi:activator of 2-hydroxyglutaryl-CoA dehydratase
MVALIREGFHGDVLVPGEAQIVGAYGAALSAEAGREEIL